jgi:hypothetical protein
MKAARLALGVAAAVVALGGCGLGEGSERSGAGATLRVTRDFGQDLVVSGRAAKVREDQTVMRLLTSNAEVATRFGGRFVQSIDGVSGKGASGGYDWFYWVNGLLASKGAADYVLSPGDFVQWDYHDWRVTQDIRAIVGAYPEPFLSGVDGKKLPVRVECADPGSGPCTAVKETFSGVGVLASGAALGAPGNQKVIRVVVAPWSRARRLPTVRAIEQGPRRSGVFARFTEGGESLELLGPGGEVVRRAGPGEGLVAALRPTDTELVWVLTGVDAAGVAAAAAALRARDLRDAFAVVAGPAGVEKLPLEAGR